jgi:Two component regulator propeller
VDRYSGRAQYIRRNDRHTTYSQREGLPGNVVGCVLEDGHGDLWMSTDNGVARFDPQGKTFRSYSTADGLPGPDSFRLPPRNSLGYAGLVHQARGRKFRQSFELRRKIVLRNHDLDEQRAGGVLPSSLSSKSSNYVSLAKAFGAQGQRVTTTSESPMWATRRTARICRRA